MANRYLRQFPKTFDTEAVIIDGYASINDSVGTPTFTAGGGVTSVTRTAAGVYDIVLDDSWPLVLYKNVSLNMLSGLQSIDPVCTFEDPLVTKKFTYKFLNTSAVAVELLPQVGFYFMFVLKNSGLIRGQ